MMHPPGGNWTFCSAQHDTAFTTGTDTHGRDFALDDRGCGERDFGLLTQHSG